MGGTPFATGGIPHSDNKPCNLRLILKQLVRTRADVAFYRNKINQTALPPNPLEPCARTGFIR